MFQDPSFGKIKITYVVTNLTEIVPAQVVTRSENTILIGICVVIWQSRH